MTISSISKSGLNGEKNTSIKGARTVDTNVVAVDFLVIGGGGGGAMATQQSQGSGAGGSGGYVNSYGTETNGGTNETVDTLRLLADGTTTYTVTIGAGGAMNAGGTNSHFSSIVAAGGGRGARHSAQTATSGGSAGGGSHYTAGNSTESVRYSPRGDYTQGFLGGDGHVDGGGGGGGGAGQAGSTATSAGGAGGDGLSSSITGSAVFRGGGGGGGASTPGSGGAGGGGNGANGNGQAATVNTGGGGGGASLYINGTRNGGAGGSGVVIVRYPNTYTISVGAGLTYTDSEEKTDGTDKYVEFTAGTGTVTFSSN